MKFKVAEDVRYEAHDPVLGAVECEFKAGDVTPKSEQEESALRGLVDMGMAELVDDSTPAYRDVKAETTAEAKSAAKGTKRAE